MVNGAVDEAGDVVQCHCPGTPVPEPWDAAYHHWCPSSRAVQGGGAPVLAPRSGQLGTRPGSPQCSWDGAGWSSPAGSGAQPWLCARGNGCGWPWGRQTGFWEGAMPRRSSLPSWQGWEPLPAPGDNSDSSSHPTLSCPSTQGWGTAGVCTSPSLALGAGSGGQHPPNGARVKELRVPSPSLRGDPPGSTGGCCIAVPRGSGKSPTALCTAV